MNEPGIRRREECTQDSLLQCPHPPSVGQFWQIPYICSLTETILGQYAYHSCPGQLESFFQCCIAKSWSLVRRQDFCCLTPGQLDIQGESLDQMARWRRSIPDNLSVPLTHSPLCILSPWVSNAAQVAISSGFLLTLSNYFLGACLVIRAIHLLPLMDSSSHHCLWTKSWWDTMHLLSFILFVFTRKPVPNSRYLLFFK